MKYYLIAGEASGDLHGSNLMKGLFAEDPQADVRFWGGPAMEAVGGTKVRDYSGTAVMGFTDVVRSLGKISRNLKDCKADILAHRPDVVILIDYPGFNMKIAQFCHEKGIRVFYYIAPKTWASREGRNRKLKAWVDRLFIVFPFEIPYFTRRGIPFTYKGNPLVDAVDGHSYSSPLATRPDSPLRETSPGTSDSEGRPDSPLRETSPKIQSFPEGTCQPATRYIAILPGSRKGEISHTMPNAMKMADALHSLPQYSDYKFIVAGAPRRSEEDYAGYIGGRDYVQLISGRTYDILRFADAALVNSGTASLEAALIGTPQVVCWSTQFITAFLAKYVLRVLDHVKFISLGNLILDRQAFRELIQYDYTPEAATAEIRRLIEDAPYRQKMLDDYAEIRAKLGGGGASRAVAKAMIEEVRGL